jgi:hypothetical protein
MSGITFGSMFLAYFIGPFGVVSMVSSAMMVAASSFLVSLSPELAASPDPEAGVAGLAGAVASPLLSAVLLSPPAGVTGLASVFELAGLAVLSLEVVESVFYESDVDEPPVVVLSA